MIANLAHGAPVIRGRASSRDRPTGQCIYAWAYEEGLGARARVATRWMHAASCMYFCSVPLPPSPSPAAVLDQIIDRSVFCLVNFGHAAKGGAGAGPLCSTCGVSKICGQTQDSAQLDHRAEAADED
eukprot:2418493-Pyramimonas_sp.AAC.1